MLPVTQKDLLDYRFLSSLRFSPDGTRAAFVAANANAAEDSYEQRLWLYENGALRQLTDLGKEGSFVWLDAQRLLFPAVRSAAEKKRAKEKDEFTAYYVLDLRGGEALPCFTLPFRAESIRVLDQTHFAVTATVDRDFPDLYCASEEDRKAYLERKKNDTDYEVLSELPFWGNGQGIINGQRTRLFLVSLDPMTVTPLTTPPEDLLCLTVLGDELFYAQIPWDRKYRMNGFVLRACDWHTGESRELCRDEVLRPEGLEAVGNRLWLIGTEGKRYGLNENAWVYDVDPATGAIQVLRQEEYCLYNSLGTDCRLGGGRQAVAAPEGLYHLSTRGGNVYLHLLHPDGTDQPCITLEGSVDCFDVFNGKILLIGLYEMRLQELYDYDPVRKRLTQRSHFNDGALKDRYVAVPQTLRVESAGLEIEGWVLPPLDFDPEKKYPAVLDIHGGPKTVYGPVFYHEMQVWASLGYFVFFCNPKGSDGGTNEFMDIRGHYGDTDYVNLMDFADAVLAKYPQIDPARVCVTGGSYGGFMTNWIIGHTDRFCCAASQRSIANWLGFYGTSDIGPYFASDQTGGNIYDSPDKLWEQSPLKYARNAVTPTLFIHADEDYRCPMAEGIQMCSALLDRGIEARLCLFHGENHELSRSGKPSHRQRRLKEITDWFIKHT